MPSRVKLLNAAAPGTTGTPFRIGTGAPPYSIRVVGSFTNGSGGVGTNGVNIETSPDPIGTPDASATWDRAIGILGGQNISRTETTTAELVDMLQNDNAVIQYYCQRIRAKLGANAIGTATVYVEMPR